MATIEKRGNSYKIVTSSGYDIHGKQIRRSTTWTPNPGMTNRQIEKELQRQSVLFEESVKHSTLHSGSIRLVEFTDIFLNDYARKLLKSKTAFSYEKGMKKINDALGHIKLKDLKQGHISEFYSNLQEEGIREKEIAFIKIDFGKWLEDNELTLHAFGIMTKISEGVLRRVKYNKAISKNSALVIANFMGKDGSKIKEIFTFQKDDTPLKAGTIQTYHRILSAVLSKAVKWGYIERNPATNVDLPSIAGRRAAYLDEPDVRRLLDLLRQEPFKWRSIIIFDLLSGLRLGELAGLRWQDVNFNTQTVLVSQTANYIPGKGVYVDTPKTTKSSRPIKLSQAAFYILLECQKWQERQEASLGDAWKNDDGRVFVGDEGTPMFPGSISQWFTKFVKRSGLPKITIHSLRHTYASIMIADGIPLVVVSHQLGHAQSSTTANIYAHVIASAEAKAAQTFDKFNDSIMYQSKPPTKIRKIK